MSKYRKGARLEYELANKLRDMGLYAYRAAGSHGPFDIFAWHWDIGLFIQVKTKGTAREWKRFINAPVPPGIIKVWAERPDRQDWKLTAVR